MASVAVADANEPRTLQEFATPELLHLLLSVVPTGIVTGWRDFAVKKERAPGTSGNGLKRVPREANCSELAQPAPWRLSTLFWLSCPVLVLVNMPILAFVLFLMGPAIVLLVTSFIVPVGLLGLATCVLRVKDDKGGVLKDNQPEIRSRSAGGSRDPAPGASCITRKKSYSSGLATCASMIQTLERSEAGSTSLAPVDRPRKDLSEQELISSLATSPVGRSLLLLADSMHRPLSTIFTWLQRLKPEISLKVSFKVAVCPDSRCATLLGYPLCTSCSVTPLVEVGAEEAPTSGPASLLLEPTPSAAARSADGLQELPAEEQPGNPADVAAERPPHVHGPLAQLAPLKPLELAPLCHSPSLPALHVLADPLQEAIEEKARQESTSKQSGFALRYLMAQRYSDTRVARLKQLLRAGADPATCNLSGATALHIAAWKGKGLEVMKLIEYGAQVDAADDCGLTPLHMAVWHRNLSAVTVLLQFGADVNAQTSITYAHFKSALTPLHLALLRECKLIVHMLLMAHRRAQEAACDGSDGQAILRTASLPSLAELASSVQRDGRQAHIRVIESAMEYFTDGVFEEAGLQHEY